MPEDPQTEELRDEQLRRERTEREHARDASSDAEADEHTRRAEKAAYLRDKLAQRARSEESHD